jgi:hypothetical protein
MAPKRSPFPPFVTASEWRTAYQATWDALSKKRGFENADDGTILPITTNEDAIVLIRAWIDGNAAGRQRFPLWYQFAAVAYGWSPKRDKLDASTKQGDRLYPTEIAKELWLAMFRLSGDLDDEKVTRPKLVTDSDFGDPVFVAGLRTELQQDGAQAQFKIPTGMCKDAKTGRARVPRPKCDANGQGPINPLDPRGPRLPCDKPGDCTSIDIDDPITGIGKALKKDVATFAILALVAWFVLKDWKA